jgi:N utilization substance protein B
MNTGSRHRARESAFQMLYQWEVGGAAPAQIAADYLTIEQEGVTPLTPVNRRFAERLMTGTVEHVAELDRLIGLHARHWRIERIAIVDRLILRLAIFELLHLPDTPPNVVIDEAIELARTFSEEEAVRFVNGVLDAVYKSLP